MKLFYSLFFILLLINTSFAASIRGLDGFQENKIDAIKNAGNHNNMGNLYFSEKNYNAALREYEIAYKLTKNTNAAAPYLYNIARCMIKTGNYNNAIYFINEAIKKDCINITYYKTLADCYVNLGIAQKGLNKYLYDDSNPYNRIIAGLIYLKLGQKTNAKIIFDEFITDNPDMIISDDIRHILKEL